jgi:hypothetical protein
MYTFFKFGLGQQVFDHADKSFLKALNYNFKQAAEVVLIQFSIELGFDQVNPELSTGLGKDANGRRAAGNIPNTLQHILNECQLREVLDKRNNGVAADGRGYHQCCHEVLHGDSTFTVCLRWVHCELEKDVGHLWKCREVRVGARRGYGRERDGFAVAGEKSGLEEIKGSVVPLGLAGILIVHGDQVAFTFLQNNLACFKSGCERAQTVLVCRVCVVTNRVDRLVEELAFGNIQGTAGDADGKV